MFRIHIGVYYSCFVNNTREAYALNSASVREVCSLAMPWRCVPDQGVPERYSLEYASHAGCVPNMDCMHACGGIITTATRINLDFSSFIHLTPHMDRIKYARPLQFYPTSAGFEAMLPCKSKQVCLICHIGTQTPGYWIRCQVTEFDARLTGV